MPNDLEIEKDALDQSLIASVSVTPAVLGNFSDTQVDKAWRTYNEWFDDAVRMDQDADKYVTPGENIYNEMRKRGLRISNRMPLSPMFTKQVNLPLAKAGLPMASGGTTWDAGAARAAIRKWATDSSGNIDTAKYGQAFLYHGTPANLLTSYKFPIATVINGVLTAVPNAIRAAKGRLLGSSIPAAAKDRIASVLAGYSKRLGWTDMHKSDVEPQRPILKEGQPLVAFVSGSPDDVEYARGKPMVGVAGATFERNYLEPLGLKRSDVAIMHQVPVLLKSHDGHARGPTKNEVLEWKDWTAKELDNIDPDITIALGHNVGDSLVADFVLPHPKVLTKMAKSGSVNLAGSELVRNLKEIKKVLNAPIEPQYVQIDMVKSDCPKKKVEPEGDQKTTTQKMSKSLTNNDHQFELFRADEPEKRNLVYGIAYVPNRLDSQRQWAPPEVLKEAAHWHMENSQLADTEHQKLADARLVESSILDTDQEFGGLHIPAGSWKIAHNVSDELKKDFDDGKYVGHSMFGRVEGYYGEAPPGYMAKSGDDVDSIFKITKIRAATMGFVSTVANELPVVVTECEGDCPLA